MNKIILVLSFVVFGIIFVILGREELNMARKSEKWPFADGIIVKSNVKISRRYRGEYYADIVYEFDVAGKRYHGDKITFGGECVDMSCVYNIVRNEYPKNKRVKVYYDPDNPEISILEPGVRAITYFPLGGGILFLLIGISVLLSHVKF